MAGSLIILMVVLNPAGKVPLSNMVHLVDALFSRARDPLLRDLHSEPQKVVAVLRLGGDPGTADPESEAAVQVSIAPGVHWGRRRRLENPPLGCSGSAGALVLKVSDDVRDKILVCSLIFQG